MRTVSSLLLFVGCLLFWSCGKETIFKKNIHNNSSQNIHFYFFGNHNPNLFGDTVIVMAGEEKEIYTYFEENSSVATPQPCELYNDSIQIVVDGGGRLTKSLFDQADWDYTETDKGDQSCTFIITDADIQ